MKHLSPAELESLVAQLGGKITWPDESDRIRQASIICGLPIEKRVGGRISDCLARDGQ